MKRLFAILLILPVLLCACADQPQVQETTQPETTTSTVPEPACPVDPFPNFGLYEPASTIEVLTRGAVKKYPLEGTGYYAVRPMGEGLLLFSGDENTVLTYLREDADPVTATLTGCHLDPDDLSTRISESGISYFDEAERAQVFLDSSLKETARLLLPEDMVCAPVLSEDWGFIYYFNAVSLRCLEIETGISRFLKDCTFPTQEITGLHFDGSVLECYVFDGEVAESIFISTQNGKTLFASESFPILNTQGNWYFAQWQEGFLTQLLFGIREGNTQCLVPFQEDTDVMALPGMAGAVLYDSDSTGASLEYYDLRQGIWASSVRLAGFMMPWSIEADVERGLIWFLSADLQDQSEALCCWDPTMSPTGDTTNCVAPYYTVLEPDTAGLGEITRQAKELGSRYGLKILVWEDSARIRPDDYTFEAEYQVPVYQRYLPILEQALSAFPEGFFAKLDNISGNGVLTLCLVRGAYGDNEIGSLTSAEGAFFWYEGNAYLSLVMNENFEGTFYHELFHAIDTYVLTETKAYDFWNELNPAGFEYDNDYISNQYREDYQYLEADTRAFIDMYSMSYPKEDRARIMEYAMMEGNGQYFTSPTMQAKLKTLCQGIREAFGLKKSATVFRWEQYLEVPLAA